MIPGPGVPVPIPRDRHPQPERRRRIWTYLLVFACVMAAPLLGGQLANVALAALAAAVFSVVWWWLSEVGTAAEPADWSTVSFRWLRGRGSDPRAARLHRQIGDLQSGGRAAAGVDLALGQSLVALMDDRVLAHHGVSADSDLAHYRAIVGGDLAAFRAAVVAEHVRLRARDLPTIISRIEQL